MFAEFLIGRGLIAVGNLVNLMTLLFYGIFKPVNGSVSLLASIFSLVGCTVGSLGVFHLAPLQLNPLVFFGPYCLLTGYLILRSSFLPRFLGVLKVLTGLGWLIFLSPSLPKDLSVPLALRGIVAEGSLMLWLLVMGVDEQPWSEQSAVSAQGPS